MYQENQQQKFKSLEGKKDALVLSIESSCDETAAAVTRGGRVALSNVISSQIAIHTLYGGVVPEIASRNHTQAIMNVVDEALVTANVTLKDIDAIAVTKGAGLVGALLIGVSAAKALSMAANIPLIGVNHIEGHIFSGLIENPSLQPPFLGVVTSGGHTSLIEVLDYNRFKLIGSTLDDAIGEAFDKVARILGLPYPGGPNVDRLSKDGKSFGSFFKKERASGNEFAFSYSGLKTAVVNYVHTHRQKGEEININDIARTFTSDAIGVLMPGVLKAVKETKAKNVVLCGGVAANSFLRDAMKTAAQENNFNLTVPSPILCTDNAAMIGCRGFYSLYTNEESALADLTLNAQPSLRVCL